ncbi:hypothetical protein ZIOFF_040129 [Zingiber officinale]|uniref:Zinc finger C2H2 LYAR-type domain-containing protein n=1 Tax=Zingiber officinale TaxID=94328 RepID=A0A8J5G5N6_ZINOF|nr:hypothetical protein ZIOFF_040129 [Zingiber officinale]
MVWFQCEDCGENLKKPKLPNHFRIFSACKLSCMNCGKTFYRNSMQSHNLCNTTTINQQTLLLHADDKKHRAKAKAYHASHNQSSQTVVSASNKEVSGDKPFASSDGSNNMKNEDKSKD